MSRREFFHYSLSFSSESLVELKQFWAWPLLCLSFFSAVDCFAWEINNPRIISLSHGRYLLTFSNTQPGIFSWNGLASMHTLNLFWLCCTTAWGRHNTEEPHPMLSPIVHYYTTRAKGKVMKLKARALSLSQVDYLCCVFNTRKWDHQTFFLPIDHSLERVKVQHSWILMNEKSRT